MKFYGVMKILKFLNIIFLILSSEAIAASFDCNNASTKIEKQICANEDLSILDKNMAENYSHAMRLTTERKEITQSQLEWLKTRNACSDVGCLIDSYKTRIEDLRLRATNHIYEYSLSDNYDSLAKNYDNGVCKAFLNVLNKTAYETLYQDNFGKFLAGFDGFSPLSWIKQPDGEQQFYEILERKIVYDEKPSDANVRLNAFKKYNEKIGGFEYYLSEATFFPQKNSNRKFPLLLVLGKQIKFPDTRPDWHSIFLTDDKKSFWLGEGDKYLEWSMLYAKTIFMYKNNYYALDASIIERVSILPVERYGNSVCSYTLKR